jgi:hypothetical protein
LFEEEDLDPTDPDNLYFVYICTKQADMVEKKQAMLRFQAREAKRKADKASKGKKQGGP